MIEQSRQQVSHLAQAQQDVSNLTVLATAVPSNRHPWWWEHCDYASLPLDRNAWQQRLQAKAPVLVVLYVFNELAKLNLCLQALEHAVANVSAVILCDDGSTDPKVRQRLQRSVENPKFQIIRTSQRAGLLACRERAMQLACNRGADLLWLDTEVVLTSNWLQHCWYVGYSATDIATVNPAQTSMDGAVLQRYFAGTTAAISPEPSVLESYSRAVAQLQPTAVSLLEVPYERCAFIRYTALQKLQQNQFTKQITPAVETESWFQQLREPALYSWRHLSVSAWVVVSPRQKPALPKEPAALWQAIHAAVFTGQVKLPRILLLTDSMQNACSPALWQGGSLAAAEVFALIVHQKPHQRGLQKDLLKEAQYEQGQHEIQLTWHYLAVENTAAETEMVAVKLTDSLDLPLFNVRAPAAELPLLLLTLLKHWSIDEVWSLPVEHHRQFVALLLQTLRHAAPILGCTFRSYCRSYFRS